MSLLFLCYCSAPCVLSPHLCVVLCVGVTFCFLILCVLVSSATLVPSEFWLFFSPPLPVSYCVHHTWVKQPSQPLQLVSCHTGVEEVLSIRQPSQLDVSHPPSAGNGAWLMEEDTELKLKMKTFFFFWAKVWSAYMQDTTG